MGRRSAREIGVPRPLRPGTFTPIRVGWRSLQRRGESAPELPCKQGSTATPDGATRREDVHSRPPFGLPSFNWFSGIYDAENWVEKGNVIKFFATRTAGIFDSAHLIFHGPSVLIKIGDRTCFAVPWWLCLYIPLHIELFSYACGMRCGRYTNWGPPHARK